LDAACAKDREPEPKPYVRFIIDNHDCFWNRQWPFNLGRWKGSSHLGKPLLFPTRKLQPGHVDLGEDRD
jgi:hypothetical protein